MMMDSYFSGQADAENRQKPFRSRSHSLESSRKKWSVSNSNLIRAADSYLRSTGSDEDCKTKDRKHFRSPTNPNSRWKSVNKYRERKFTCLYGRNACRYICNILRFVGMLISFIPFGLHLQYQWQMGNYTTGIIVLTTTAATSLTFVIVLYSFFGLKSFSRSIVHFWVSFAYGIIFVQQTHLKLLNKTIMACIIISAAIRCLCSFMERMFRLTIHKSQFLSLSEFCDIIGFGLACLSLPLQKCIDMWFQVVTLGFLVINTRMKSPFSIQLIVLCGIVSGISVIGNIGVKTNKYVLIIFSVRLLWDPLLDIYFSKLPPLTRWGCFFQLSRAVLFPLLFLLFALCMVFFAFASQAISLHPKYEWPIVIPFFAVSGFGWFVMHVTKLFLYISFLSKVAKCKVMWKEQPMSTYKTFQNTMSRQGVRSLSAICHDVSSGTVFMTGVFGSLCWRRQDGTYPAFFLFIATVEFLSLTLFRHLSTRLRGTAYGLGIAGATSPFIQSFFNDQYIETFGCESWSSGTKLTLSLMEKKLETLFSKETPYDNHPYDSYIVFYSGMADEEGSWILDDRKKLPFEKIVNIWNNRKSPVHSGKDSSRLLIISDALNSSKWLEKVRCLKGSAISVQTCTYLCDEKLDKIKPSISVESTARRGDFTLIWTAFLKSLLREAHLGELSSEILKRDFIDEIRGQGMKAQYSFSRSFSSGLLSSDSGNFYHHPCTICCLPVVFLTSCLSNNFFSIITCGAFSKICHRFTLRFLRRKTWDIGGGIVLVNS